MDNSREPNKQQANLFLALGFLSPIMPIDVLRPDRMKKIGAVYLWSIPLFETLLRALAAAVALLCERGLGSAWAAPICFVMIDHMLHGFRRIDGFSDIAEGLAFRWSKPEASLERAWEVIRAPQNGPYGTTLIVFYLLSQLGLLLLLRHLGIVPFLLGIGLAGLLSVLSAGWAMAAPNRIDPDSSFAPFAAELARPVKIFGGPVIAFVLTAATLGLAWPGRSFVFLAAVALALTLSAVAAGFLCRQLVSRSLRQINGDVYGFAWCIGELTVLLVFCLFQTIPGVGF